MAPWHWIVATTLTGALAAAIWVVNLTPVYRATAQVVLGPVNHDQAEQLNELIYTSSVLAPAIRQHGLEIVVQPQRRFSIGHLTGDGGQRTHDDVEQPVSAGDYGGGKTLEISELDLPRSLIGAELTLIAGADQNYSIQFRGKHLLSGRVGPLIEADGIAVRVTSLSAPADSRFVLVRQGWLDTLNALRENLNCAITQGPAGIVQLSLDATDPATATATLDTVISEFLTHYRLAYPASARQATARAEPALVLGAPVRLRHLWSVSFGLIIGLGAGIGLVWARQALQPVLRRPADFAAMANLPLLSVIGRDVHQVTSRASDCFTTEPEVIDGLRSLSTAVDVLLLDRVHRVVTLTASGPRAGATFIVANLAVLLAQAGHKVLLIDADAESAALHGVFGATPQAGLAAVMAGELALDDVITAAVSPGVDLVAAGSTPHSTGAGISPGVDLAAVGATPQSTGAGISPELWQAQLRDLSQRYQTILIDQSGSGCGSGACGLADRSVHLLVVRSGSQKNSQLIDRLRAMRRSQVTVDGVVLNDFSPATDS